MPDPAPHRIMTAFGALLAVERPDLTVEVDRSDEQPFQDDEVPAVSLRCVALAINQGPEQLSTGNDWYQMTFQADCWSKDGNLNSIDLENQKSIASIIKVCNANPTLGGLIWEPIFYSGITGFEEHGANVGCTILEMVCIFTTTKGDLTEILGANGLPIP